MTSTRKPAQRKTSRKTPVRRKPAVQPVGVRTTLGELIAAAFEVSRDAQSAVKLLCSPTLSRLTHRKIVTV